MGKVEPQSDLPEELERFLLALDPGSPAIRFIRALSASRPAPEAAQDLLRDAFQADH